MDFRFGLIAAEIGASLIPETLRSHRPNVAVVEIGSDDDLGMEFSPMRQTGTVKFFNTTRGFGFITPETGGKDIFVHITALERSGLPALADGTRVTFSVEEDRRGRGPQAVDVQLA